MPTIAQKIAVDYVTDALGEDLGSALAAGGSKDMKTIHQNGGGGPSGLAETEAYYVETQKVIAEYAEIERLEKSPFDATSKYTFLGSIVGKLVPYATQASTISSTLTSIGSIFSRSLSSMLPSAMALDSLELRRNLGNCPFLEDIGVVGDAYCMPYMTNDLSTIDKDPEEVLQMMIDWGDVTCGAGDPNCDKDDSSPKIVDKIQDYSDNNPNLSGYINFCLNRTAPFGQNDASIPAVIAGTSTGNAGLDGALNAAPIIGDIIDVIDGWSTIQSQGIAIGESCTYSPKNTSKLNERLPYYAQFVTDERVMEIITDCEYRSIVGEYLGSECTPLEEGDSGGLKTGGLTLKEAEDFFKPYVEHRTTNYPSGCPNAVQHWDNCSSVPTWFINDHTTLNTHVTANGNETANRTISENPDKFKMSDLSDSPSPYSIAQSTSAAASPNHTYMVVGVTSSKMIILEAGCGNGPSFTRAKEVDLSYGNGYKFLDISKFVKK